MPQKRENLMTIRLSSAGYARIEVLAQEFKLPRATVMRQMLAVALGHEKDLRSQLDGLRQGAL